MNKVFKIAAIVASVAIAAVLLGNVILTAGMIAIQYQ